MSIQIVFILFLKDETDTDFIISLFNEFHILTDYYYYYYYYYYCTVTLNVKTTSPLQIVSQYCTHCRYLTTTFPLTDCLPVLRTLKISHNQPSPYRLSPSTAHTADISQPLDKLRRLLPPGAMQKHRGT